MFLFFVFFLIRSSLLVLGRDTTEENILIISSQGYILLTLHITVDLLWFFWLRQWFPGFSTKVTLFLFSQFLCRMLWKQLHVFHTYGVGIRLTSLTVSLFGILMYWRFIYLLPFMSEFSHLFILVCTYEYLFYILGIIQYYYCIYMAQNVSVFTS